MANQRFGCQVDGVRISETQVEFANDQAAQRGVADQVRFHFRNMLDTGFETGSRQGIWTNETTMYVDLYQLFGEFARLLRARRPLRLHHRLLQRRLPAAAPRRSARSTQHYTCNIHPRSEYFKALAANDFVPINVIDLTADTIPYWELRAQSSVATGIEDPFLTAYREGSFHYLLIVADYVGSGLTCGSPRLLEQEAEGRHGPDAEAAPGAAGTGTGGLGLPPRRCCRAGPGDRAATGAAPWERRSERGRADVDPAPGAPAAPPQHPGAGSRPGRPRRTCRCRTRSGSGATGPTPRCTPR